jgi:hypothetical protein
MFMAFSLGGCFVTTTAGKISNAVGEGLHKFSDKQDSGIIKDGTKIAGDAHVFAGNAVAPKKAEAAKAPAPAAKDAATSAKKVSPGTQKVKATTTKAVEPKGTNKEM